MIIKYPLQGHAHAQVYAHTYTYTHICRETDSNCQRVIKEEKCNKKPIYTHTNTGTQANTHMDVCMHACMHVPL